MPAIVAVSPALYTVRSPSTVNVVTVERIAVGIGVAGKQPARSVDGERDIFRDGVGLVIGNGGVVQAGDGNGQRRGDGVAIASVTR